MMAALQDLLDRLRNRNDKFVFVLFIFSVVAFILVTKWGLTSKSVQHVKVHDSRVFVNRSRTIPKIVHIIWNNETLPSEYVPNIESFLKNNPPPSWQYYFWTKESGLKFIKDIPFSTREFPTIKVRIFFHQDNLDLIVTVTSNFYRADTLRYLTLHEYGGVYFDLDTISVKPLDPYVNTHECSLALEPGEHYFQWNFDMLITNGALLCVPQHPFYKLIVLSIWEHTDNCRNAFQCTGPEFMTNLYKKVNKTSGIVSRLPDLQSSEIFQDIYDSKINDGILRDKCSNTSKLQPDKVAICENWKARGMNKRNLSEKAFTYHTWYHSSLYKLTYSDENLISKIIPHVKIYGRNLW